MDGIAAIEAPTTTTTTARDHDPNNSRNEQQQQQFEHHGGFSNITTTGGGGGTLVVHPSSPSGLSLGNFPDVNYDVQQQQQQQHQQQQHDRRGNALLPSQPTNTSGPHHSSSGPMLDNLPLETNTVMSPVLLLITLF